MLVGSWSFLLVRQIYLCSLSVNVKNYEHLTTLPMPLWWKHGVNISLAFLINSPRGILTAVSYSTTAWCFSMYYVLIYMNGWRHCCLCGLCVHVWVCRHTFVHAFLHVCVYVCTWMHTHVSVVLCICVCVCVCMCTHACINFHAFVHVLRLSNDKHISFTTVLLFWAIMNSHYVATEICAINN